VHALTLLDTNHRTEGASQTFTWNTGASATQYWIDIDSSHGANDIYSSSQGTNTSATIGGQWYNTQTPYTAGP